MPSQRNTQLLEEVKDKASRASGMFFVDYSGLTHQQLEEMRKQLSENESEIAVTKNTLMNIALQEKKIDAKELLQGPYATLFSYEDPLKTIKVLASFIKKHSLPTIKFGIFEGKIIETEMINKLATLPSKEILLGKLVGILNSPISNFVYVLNGNIVKLALVLKEIEKKKGATS